MARMTGTAVRSKVGAQRDENARQRDGIARRRDELATARDLEAEKLEDAAERMAGQLGKDSPAAKVAAIARVSAAAGRDAAARDRERAAGDRDDAARDRELLIGEIEGYDMDESTDTYGRRLGEVLLRHEVKRALSTGGAMTVAALTVDLSAKSDPDPGDTSISTEDREMALALRKSLSPLDLIVRWSKGEFVCAITTVIDADVSRLFEEARSDFAERHLGATLKIGWAAPEKGETINDLVERAKQAEAQVRD